nr:hypothetical protein [Tanacetum cinerariifolium]
MDQQRKEAVREAVQIQTDWLQDSLQRENDEFLRNIDENMKKVLKGLVKNQVKEQVSRILPRIEESVNATLEAEVLTRSSHSSRTSYTIAADLSEMELKKILIEKMEGNKTSYAIAADLSEMELKKILIEKMEGNKSIQRSDEQRNLYKVLDEAYEADKAILDTYGDSTILKRRREDDDQEGPSAGPNRGSKRKKEGGEQASASTPSDKATKGAGGSTTGDSYAFSAASRLRRNLFDICSVNGFDELLPLVLVVVSDLLFLNGWLCRITGDVVLDLHRLAPRGLPRGLVTLRDDDEIKATREKLMLDFHKEVGFMVCHSLMERIEDVIIIIG